MRGAFARVCILVCFGLSLTGCAELQFLFEASKVGSTGITPPGDPSRPDPGRRYKIGIPYDIKGIWYYPKVDYGYVEEGIASWYGATFHGRLTANGAIFDETKVSAAHRTLPLPSVVRVTNLENGRSIRVVVNDRGPFAHSRIIDLSRRAAQLLGYEMKGTALVRVEVLETESRQLAAAMPDGGALSGTVGPADIPPPPKTAPTVAVASEDLAPPPGIAAAPDNTVSARPDAPSPAERPAADVAVSGDVSVFPVPPDPTVFIQAGAFGQYHNAKRAQVKLGYLGPIVVEEITRSSTPLFRVRLGPLKDDERLESLLVAVIQAGYSDARIVVESD